LRKLTTIHTLPALRAPLEPQSGLFGGLAQGCASATNPSGKTIGPPEALAVASGVTVAPSTGAALAPGLAGATALGTTPATVGVGDACPTPSSPKTPESITPMKRARTPRAAIPSTAPIPMPPFRSPES
jgi:hypothetical protein